MEKPNGRAGEGTIDLDRMLMEITSDAHDDEELRISQEAKACKQPGGPFGRGTVSVRFATTGDVISAQASAPFTNTAVGDCVSARFRAAHVPPFGGDPVTVYKPSSIE